MAELYPIANLYPVVTAGEPDWREYYTVNLLNLPHHYHNGGIWPFIGGAWVRFVDKLGLRDLAVQELYKLAQLNSWEFSTSGSLTNGRTARREGPWAKPTRPGRLLSSSWPATNLAWFPSSAAGT